MFNDRTKDFNDKLKSNPLDINIVYDNTLRILKSYKPNHPILDLLPKEQKELMALLLKGQGYYVRNAIKEGRQSMSLPGLGTFRYNPLRVIVKKIRKELHDKLEPFEINQLIKEKLMDFYATNENPFKRDRAQVYKFNFNTDTEDDND